MKGNNEFLNRSLIVITPKQPYIDWLNSLNIVGNKYTVDQYRDDCTTYLVSDISDKEEVKKITNNNYRFFFEQNLRGITRERNCWPARITLELFIEWFEVRYHTMILDISDEPLGYDEDL